MQIEKLVAPLKNYIWGGTKLKNEYGKTTELPSVAESWELSFHKDGKTMLENGMFLSDVVSKIDLGSNCDSFEFSLHLLNLSMQKTIYQYKSTLPTTMPSQTKIVMVKPKCGT